MYILVTDQLKPKSLLTGGKALTLQPALPNANAIALPIPLEAPVTTTTGASTF